MTNKYTGKKLHKFPNEFYHCTLEEIAQELGVTRERVRQIETQALNKIAIKLRNAGITEEDLYIEKEEGF